MAHGIRRVRTVAALSLLTIAALVSRRAADGAGAESRSSRVSVSSDGAEADGDSWGFSAEAGTHWLSADGRVVAFWSAAANLVAGDTNSSDDVFVHDRQTGETRRVSVSSSGAEANGRSSDPSLSADGRFVSFRSEATNLVDGDSNGVADVFVHDRANGTTKRVSVGGNGAEANRASTNASISADGRFVAFASTAFNLVDDDSNRAEDVFVHDRETGQTIRVSVSGSGADGDRASRHPGLSADGRYIVFISDATNLVAGDTNDEADVFVHDRQTGETSRVSVSGSGGESNGSAIGASISGDGNVICFDSDASNLVDEDTNGKIDVFVHDRTSGATTRVSVSGGGTQAAGISYLSSISGDGRVVTFSSEAMNLVDEADTNGAPDVFVRDMARGVTVRVGEARRGVSAGSTLSENGRVIAFTSTESDLVDGDGNGALDVFVTELDIAPPGVN